MIQYIADEAHFQEVIARIANVKGHLWIGTADIKDMYVGERPLLGVLADLISKGREIRLIHPKNRARNSGRISTIIQCYFPDWSGFCAPEYTSN